MTLPTKPSCPGLSARVLGLAFAGLCFCGWVVSTATGPLGWQRAAGVGSLAMAALSFLAVVLGINGVRARFVRSGARGKGALGKGELLCLVYLLLAGAPLMGLGFWVRAVSVAAAPEQRAAWELVDLFPGAFRPEGPNLLAPGAIDLSERLETATGRAETRRDNGGRTLHLAGDEESGATARFPLTLVEDGVFHHASYLFSARFRFEGRETVNWSVRMLPDQADGAPLELVRGRGPGQPDATGPVGFSRAGNYGFAIPGETRETVWMELRIEGAGTLTLRDLHLTEVTALTQFFEGRPVLSREEFEALPPSRQAGVSVRPDTLFSLAGIRHVLGGRIPWRFWSAPLLAWTTFLLLLFSGTFAIAVIMRRQWLDRERFPMPLTYPVVDLIGGSDTSPRFAPPPILRNGGFWFGFAAASLVAVSAIGFAFHPALPNPQPVVSMRSYFAGGDWGDMWKFSFQIIPFVFAVGLLLDLNISLSVVVGFFLFRFQYYIGAQTGWAGNSTYPFVDHQFSGATLAYGLMLLYFARRHLLKSAKIALRGSESCADDESESKQDGDTGDDAPFGYRFGYGLQLLSGVGFLIWCASLGAGPGGALILWSALMVLAFVLMRVRAETGLPFAFVGSSVGALLLAPVAGGLGCLGAEAFGLNHILGGLLFGATILVVAGLQVEFLELARRYRIPRWHIPATFVLAILGGVAIGGWFFLNAHYAEGANNAQHATQYSVRPTTFYHMRDPLDAPQQAMAGEPPPPSGNRAETAAFFFGGAVMVGLTLLRQLFAGFWFHPVGFLLGPFMETLWGGLLAAWLVRLLVGKLGGASTVRDKLRPFAVGMIAALAVFYLAGFAVNLYVAAVNPGQDLFFWKMTPNM